MIYKLFDLMYSIEWFKMYIKKRVSVRMWTAAENTYLGGAYVDYKQKFW